MADTARQRRGGLIGGIVFLTLGLLILFRNLGWIEDFWGLVSRYWPLLLILIGLAKILEYARGTSGRLLRFGEFVLILFVVLFGLLAPKLPLHLRLPIGDRRVSVRDYYGTSFAFTEEKTLTVGANPKLLIKNAQGSVTLVSGIEGQLRVRLRKIVYARSEQQAREIAGKIHLVASADHSGCRIETNRAELTGKDLRFESSFEISVPPSLNAEIHNSNGDVSLEGLAGNHTLDTSYGRLSLIRLQGNIDGTNKYGETRASGITGDLRLNNLHGKVVAENISGDAFITNAYSPVDVSDVRGRTTINNSYGTVAAGNLKQRVEIIAPGSQVTLDGAEGDVKIRSSHKEVGVENCTQKLDLEQEYGSVRANNIGGDLVARASFASFSGSRIKGSVNIEGNSADIDLEDVRGDTTIRNRYKPVTAIDLVGGINVVNDNASITLGVSSVPRKPIVASNSYGTLEITLPEDSAFQLDARARSGEITCEFAGPQPGKESGDSRSLLGQVGLGGPQLKLETSYSNILLKKSARSK